jgi:hypothetical protein
MVLVGRDYRDDYLTDPASGYAITYAVQLPIGGNTFSPSDYGICYLPDMTSPDAGVPAQGHPTTLCQYPSNVASCTCPAQHGAPLTCAIQGSLTGRCIDEATGELPVVAHAQAYQQSLRVVVGKLMDPATLEHFACACQTVACRSDASIDHCGDVPLDPSLCPETCGIDHLDVSRCDGNAWVKDLDACGSCPNSKGDTMNGGTCLDLDQNGLPDVSSLVPGIATVTCGAGVRDGAVALDRCPESTGWTAGPSPGSCQYTTVEGDGVYEPSGNQFQSSVAGLRGVGPAIAITLNGRTSLPASSDCTIKLSDSVTTKGGEKLLATKGPPIFHTDDVRLVLAAPANNAEINSTVSTTLTVTVAANVPLDANGTATVTTELVDLNASTRKTITTGTVVVDGLQVTQTTPLADLGLVEGHLYEINVNATATDRFGRSSDLARFQVHATSVGSM